MSDKFEVVNNLLDMLEKLYIKSSYYIALPDREVERFVTRWDKRKKT